MSDFFSFSRVVEYFPKILSRIHITLIIVLSATIIGLFLGVALAFLRIYRIIVLNQLVQIFISFVRDTPIIVQMFLVYYGLPVFVEFAFKIDINRWDKLIFIIITYGLNEAGFMAEIIRASILAIPAGQTEAGYSVGLSGRQTFLRIVAPQALRVAIPPLGTNFVGLFQGTSLAYLLGIIDILGKVNVIGANTYHYLEGYTCAAVIFVVISIILEKAFKLLDKHLKCTLGK